MTSLTIKARDYFVTFYVFCECSFEDMNSEEILIDFLTTYSSSETTETSYRVTIVEPPRPSRNVPPYFEEWETSSLLKK